MKDNTLTWVLLAVGAYFVYSQYAQPSAPSFMTCRYPDGTTIQVPNGNACPVDPTHGGASVMCYPRAFTGPIPPGGAYC